MSTVSPIPLPRSTTLPGTPVAVYTPVSPLPGSVVRTPSVTPTVRTVIPTLSRRTPVTVVPTLSGRSTVVPGSPVAVTPSTVRGGTVPTTERVTVVQVPMMPSSGDDCPPDHQMKPLFKTPETIINEQVDKAKRKILKGAFPDAGAEGIQFSVMGEDLANDCVETKLAAKGYLVTGRIIVQVTNEVIAVNYLKAVTSRGHTVFVKMDLKGEIAMRPDDKVMRQCTSDALHIPYDAKVHALDCATMDVCAVAFECAGNVCVLSRKEGEVPSEINFSWVDETAAQVEGSPSPYPIVLLSEIYKDPECVADHVDKMVKKLRVLTHENAMKQLCEFGTCLEAMMSAYKNLKVSHDRTAKKLLKSLCELEGYRDVFVASPPCDPCEQEKYRELIYNLRKRYDLGEEMLSLALAACKVTPQVQTIAQMMNDTAKGLDEKTHKLDCVWPGSGNPGY